MLCNDLETIIYSHYTVYTILALKLSNYKSNCDIGSEMYHLYVIKRMASFYGMHFSICICD